jgi:hypothetical protein
MLALAIITLSACTSSDGTVAAREVTAPTSTTAGDTSVADDDGVSSPTAGVAVDESDPGDPPAGVTPDGGDPVGGEGADDTGQAEPPQVEEGTDSALVDETAPVSDAVRTTVTEFTVAYLDFDYRTDGSERIERLRPLVTEDLLATLSAPLPPALAEQLGQQERVVRAEPIDVVAVGPGIYQSVVEVTTETADGDDTIEQKLLTVVLGPDGLVHDVH